MKKIAIIGTAPTSRSLAPFDDPAWDIWGCSPGNQGQLPRVTVWFELHALVEMRGPENRGWSGPYLAWLRDQAFPLFMLQQNEFVPRAAVFPKERIQERFGAANGRTYNPFTSSISQMIAHAIFVIEAEGKGGEIALYGVDMAAVEEHYSGQKDGCQFMIDRAREAGIKVMVPYESSLAKPRPFYGYSEATPLGRRLNVVDHQISARHGDMVKQRDQLNLEIAFFAGALEQVKYFKRTWTDGSEVSFEEVDITASLRGAARVHAAQVMGTPPVPMMASSLPASDAPPPAPAETKDSTGAELIPMRRVAGSAAA